MYMNINKKLMLMLPLVLLTAITSIGINQVKAWDGPWRGYNGQECGDQNCCCSEDTADQFCQSQCFPNQGWNEGGGCGAYCAGERDAVYDLQNNLQYQPYGSCLPCHSEEYWHNFRQGYDHKWNSYQSQETNQGSSISIYGNNNYVSTIQASSQQQSPLQQLAHTVCGLINCNQPLPQQTGWGP